MRASRGSTAVWLNQFAVQDNCPSKFRKKERGLSGVHGLLCGMLVERRSDVARKWNVVEQSGAKRNGINSLRCAAE